MRASLKQFCLENGREALLAQWDGEKNAPLTPDGVTYGSRTAVWWRCGKGHSWQAQVCCRAGRGDGCPFCSGRRAIPGGNDLATLYPDLAAQWHPTKNGRLSPSHITPGCRKKVWWLCDKGHEWQAAVKARSSGSGCPVCSGHTLLPGVNDLAHRCPDLARQWHPTKNGPLTPFQLMPGSKRKVWWICGKGHEWQAMVKSRVAGVGCPFCSGRNVQPGVSDLATLYPAIAAQWDYGKNGSLTPDQVATDSHRPAWWLCGEGHSYRAEPHKRTYYHTGCPYCAGKKVLPGFNDLQTAAPEIAAQWHPTLNGSVTPRMVTAGSGMQAWWLCPFGHAWKARVFSRTGAGRTGCPICAGRTRVYFPAAPESVP